MGALQLENMCNYSTVHLWPELTLAVAHLRGFNDLTLARRTSDSAMERERGCFVSEKLVLGIWHRMTSYLSITLSLQPSQDIDKVGQRDNCNQIGMTPGHPF